MGLSNTKLPRDDLREYADITYFEQGEIDRYLCAYNIFFNDEKNFNSFTRFSNFC